MFWKQLSEVFLEFSTSGNVWPIFCFYRKQSNLEIKWDLCRTFHSSFQNSARKKNRVRIKGASTKVPQFETVFFTKKKGLSVICSFRWLPPIMFVRAAVWDDKRLYPGRLQCLFSNLNKLKILPKANQEFIVGSRAAAVCLTYLG